MADETLRILIVDDEQEIRECIQERLEIEGFFVETAMDAREAMNRLSAVTFDMIISDLRMPLINGKHILELIKFRFPDLPYVILSGHIDSEQELIELGADKVLSKPVDLDVLINTIRDLTKV